MNVYQYSCNERKNIEGRRILICHGHTYFVKDGTMHIRDAAKQNKADAALFGHTHLVFYDYHNGCVLLNPGSIGQPPSVIPPSYGIMIIDGEKQIKIETHYLED